MKKITLLLMLLGITYQASAEEYIKNGNPCLSNICIGDDIETLKQKKILWDKATANFGKTYIQYKATASDIDRIKKHVAPQPEKNFTKAAFYLTNTNNGTGKFDTNGLEQLSKIQGFCSGFSAVGTFKSESGNPTAIHIVLTPSEDGSQQKFVVKGITRNFPTNTTAEQKFQLESELDTRYQSVRRSGMYDLRLSKSASLIQDGKAAFYPSWNFSGDQLYLSSPYAYQESKDLFLKYPGCSQSLKLD